MGSRLGKVSNSKELKDFSVEMGDNYMSLASKLKKSNLINSELFYKIYVKLNDPGVLKAGTYQLTENMGVKKIVETLSETEPIKDYISVVTFIEGKNMRYVGETISKNTDNTIDQVFDLMKDETYLDELISEYWFIDESIKNTDIFYPLEGYLFMDTYEFYKKATVKEIFKVMLDKMDIELSKFKNEINKSKYSVHELLTLASIVELESITNQDRAIVAGIFYNRLNSKWALGSDVTTYYALKKDNWNGLSASELAECNSYNTRSSCLIGLPVGPISNPSLSSITATMRPEANDYYYFVADCDSKNYFNKTEYEHNQTIVNLRKENKWCED